MSTVASQVGGSSGAINGALCCNRCWKAVDDTAYVSSCSHFFCRDCARKSFSVPAASMACPVCDTNLSERANGFVREVSQKTSNKTIQLCGLTPEQILKVAARAIDFFTYQVDLAHEHERGTGKNRHHELALECDQFKERIVQYENEVNTLTHQVQRLQDANDKARAELDESVQKYEEKARQKRKLYEMYTALKQKAENQGLLYSPAPASSQLQVHARYQVPSPPPPPPPSSAQPTPVLGASSRYPAPSGASASLDDGVVQRRTFSSPSIRTVSATAGFARDRTAKSPRLSLEHSSVHHLDKFSALRSDFANRARSPLATAAASSSASVIVALQAPPQQPLQSLQQQQQPASQLSRGPLRDVSNTAFRAPVMSATASLGGSNIGFQATAPEANAFASLSYSATPMQSFAARLRRPQTPNRVRRAMPFNS